MQTIKGNGLADLKRLRKESGKQPLAKQTARPPGTGRKAVVNADVDDRNLFRSAVKSVQPLKHSKRAILRPVPQAPESILRQRRAAATGVSQLPLPQVSDLYSPVDRQGDDDSFIRAGCGPDLIKGLKRGKWPVGASLDLHGATLDEARARLDQFLQSCLTHQIKCVCVVHGKGHGSKDGTPVLKQTVRRWLTQIGPVIAYTECPEHNGGAGAVLVLLRTP